MTREPQPWEQDFTEEERFLIACAVGYRYGNKEWPKPPRSMVGQQIPSSAVRALVEKLLVKAGVVGTEAAELLAPIVPGVEAVKVWGIITFLVQLIEATR